jgi:glucoamylase
MRPGWTHSNKSAIGTAYSESSKLWFTMWKGIVTEVSFPTIDRPQLRDVQYLVTDGKSFFHEEKRDLTFDIARISEGTLGYRCTNADPAGRYMIVNDVIAHPHLSCLLQRTRITAPDAAFLAALHVYVLCAPHLEVGGYGNTGYVKTINGRRLLIAKRTDMDGNGRLLGRRALSPTWKSLPQTRRPRQGRRVAVHIVRPATGSAATRQN